jgi:flagellar biogenesis protein FliO
MKKHYIKIGLLISSFCLLHSAFAETVTNAPLTAPPFPEAGVSLIRITGALALVLGLFLGGVWLFKNWQRLVLQRHHQPKLNILESRSLGARQAIFVVAYEQQRFLVATAPTGINLLSHLPDAEPTSMEIAVEKKAAPMPFAQALAQVLKGK